MAGQAERAGQRIECEPVVVGTGRRARTAIADVPEIVRALLGRTCVGMDALAELAILPGEVEDRPVDPVSAVRIVDEQRERLGVRRYAVPGERRRDVLAVARVLGWDRLAVGECRRGQ